MLSFLCRVPLLKTLPQELHPRLAASAQTVEFESGGEVIKQGDPGESSSSSSLVKQSFMSTEKNRGD